MPGIVNNAAANSYFSLKNTGDRALQAAKLEADLKKPTPEQQARKDSYEIASHIAAFAGGGALGGWGALAAGAAFGPVGFFGAALAGGIIGGAGSKIAVNQFERYTNDIEGDEFTREDLINDAAMGSVEGTAGVVLTGAGSFILEETGAGAVLTEAGAELLDFMMHQP